VVSNLVVLFISTVKSKGGNKLEICW